MLYPYDVKKCTFPGKQYSILTISLAQLISIERPSFLSALPEKDSKVKKSNSHSGSIILSKHSTLIQLLLSLKPMRKEGLVGMEQKFTG